LYFTITHNKSGYVDGNNEFVPGDFHDYFDLLKQAFKEKRCNLRRIYDENDDGGGGGGGGGAVKATNPADELAAVEVGGCVCESVFESWWWLLLLLLLFSCFASSFFFSVVFYFISFLF
jgi:hypothetical protein